MLLKKLVKQNQRREVVTAQTKQKERLFLTVQDSALGGHVLLGKSVNFTLSIL